MDNKVKLLILYIQPIEIRMFHFWIYYNRVFVTLDNLYSHAITIHSIMQRVKLPCKAKGSNDTRFE